MMTGSGKFVSLNGKVRFHVINTIKDFDWVKVNKYAEE